MALQLSTQAHGAAGRSVTTRSINGACLSNSDHNTELYQSTKTVTSSTSTKTSDELTMSARISGISIDLSLR